MTPRKSSRAAARRQCLAMGGRELVFALAPEAGRGGEEGGESPTIDWLSIPLTLTLSPKGRGDLQSSGRGDRPRSG